MATVAAVLMLSWLGSVSAADLRFIEVDRKDGIYTLRSITWLDTKPENLYAVLTDYAYFVHFTSAMIESKNLELDAEGRPGFYTRMEGCVLLWCRTMIRVGHLELDPIDEIAAITDGERSDFKIANERWQLRAEGDGTLMIYEFEMVPDFWVPPVVGPYYMKRALKSGGERAAERIEALARGEEPLPL